MILAGKFLLTSWGFDVRPQLLLPVLLRQVKIYRRIGQTAACQRAGVLMVDGLTVSWDVPQKSLDRLRNTWVGSPDKQTRLNFEDAF